MFLHDGMRLFGSQLVDGQEEETSAWCMARREALQRELDPHTAGKPTYGQQGTLRCDRGSQIEVLDMIRDSVHHHSAGSQNFLCLTGVPGCGKSAVTASIAREGNDRKFFWA
ncbi:hypothetical protein DXG01_004710 [Tephrocybe rancida]|nr:hypothetical protein DXG01_004710 [Tephrocybe rancida]